MTATSKKTIINFITNQKNVVKSQPFKEKIDLFSVDDQMFALINDKEPMIISLRCDNLLSKFLQEKYESVMPGQKLNQEKWISIVDTGQVPVNEIKDLIVLSYNLAKEIE